MPAAADRKQRRGTFPDEEQGTEPLCRFAPEAKPHPARNHSGCDGNAADLILRIILDPRKNRSKCRQFCCGFRNCLPGAIGNTADRADRTARWGRKDRCDGDTGKWGRNDLCCGYAVRPDAEPGDPCSAGGWLCPGRDDLSACCLRCGCCL